ncbi:hypothetical protein POREN0001_0278 [Porphyromonas endodontalis ATCC 35406]|uniref:Uncharacterized protein n=1 Tax=Porphyromonas endodontalis (strain ATCC 35406 / DSM 24491 / JCM 8526 / CCUG 16442 / BCRC 14492 / NCTC 13058 / HG 370) TaxID=553175 RepID=C3JAP1_POREA|nr:hypothetical protein POREN0001_0278 [Porphyromonas endodontalis ATCC 35406]
MALLAAVGDEHGFAQSQTKALRPDGTTAPKNKTNTRLQVITKSREKRGFSLFYERGILNSVCSKLIPINLIKGLRFNEQCAISEDALFMFTLSRDIKYVGLAKDTTYYVNERESSSSRKRQKPQAIIRDSFKFIKYLTSIYFNSPKSYPFSLYLSRVVASLLFLLERLKRNRTKSNSVQ